MNVLVTGGAGYIGSHTAIELLASGHDVTVLDNLSNASPRAVDAIRLLANRDVPFVEGDIRDGELLTRLFGEGDFDAVIHFAALKAVGESVAMPLQYYDNNVGGTGRLLDCMAAAGVKTLVFSSSATVYGQPPTNPIREDFPYAPTNPYGRTKLMIEQVLRDIHAADPSWRMSCLRYFNPVGAHPSGEIGEDPLGAPNNLLPFISQVAVGRREQLEVFGDDYPTPDGTCIRDYVHISDLARGHTAALAYLTRPTSEADDGQFAVHNLGTGRGHSVLEVIAAFEAVTGAALPYSIVGRRPGDCATCYADPSLARKDFGWTARHDLQRMCEDVWRWQSTHPEGFRAA